VLEDGDLILYESRAICRYLCDKNNTHSDTMNTLIPSSINDRALVEQWISIESTIITPDLTTILVNRIWGPKRGLTTDEEQIKDSMASLRLSMEVLNKQLNGHDYIVGDSITLADIFFTPILALIEQTPEGKILIHGHSNISTWWKRVSDRSAWKAVISHVLSGYEGDTR